MRTSYARLFADENGVSHFQDVDIELIPGFAAPPAEPLHFAPLMSVEKCTLVGAVKLPASRCRRHSVRADE